MAKEYKRIVCDIDDTISFTLNRDWENAIPNQPVIDKINQLYDMGWEIYLVTARGSLSCKSRAEAYAKYAPQIKTWLQKHGVKYHQLSFDKYLAAYYVDDKGLTPEQFLNLDVKILKSGWSGAHVELREGKVFKTHKDSIDAATWYEIAKHFFNVPKIHSLIGQTICMEYIKEDESPVKMDVVLDIFYKMSEIPVNTQHVKFENYIERIKSHLEYEHTYELFKTWLEYVDIFHNSMWQNINSYLDTQSSFCHGDMTLENILVKDGVHYLIDPIYEPNKDSWSSWLLDVSKFLYSLLRYNKKHEYNYVRHAVYKKLNSEYFISNDILTWLVMSHVIRVYKYAPEQERPRLQQMYHNLYSLMKNN